MSNLITNFTGDVNEDTLVCDFNGDIYRKYKGEWVVLGFDGARDWPYWFKTSERPCSPAQCASIHSVTWFNQEQRWSTDKPSNGPSVYTYIPYLTLYLSDITVIDDNTGTSGRVVAAWTHDKLNAVSYNWDIQNKWTILDQGDCNEVFMDKYWASYSMEDIQFAIGSTNHIVPGLQECRFDPYNGKVYTKGEFLDQYGNLVEWDFMESRKILVRKDLFKIMNSLNALPKENFNALLDRIIETYL